MPIKEFKITGAKQRLIDCRLFERDNKSPTVVMLPGGDTTCDTPFLYFAADFFASRGHNILQIHTDSFRNVDFMKFWQAGDRDAIRAWRTEDAQAIGQYLQKTMKEPVIFIAFSAGTRYVAEFAPIVPSLFTLWISPGLHGRWDLLKQRKSDLVVIGEKDSYYAEAKDHLPKDALVLKNSGHSLEIDNDLHASIDNLHIFIKFLNVKIPASL